MFVDGAFADEISEEEAFADEISEEEAFADEISEEEAFADEIFAEEIFAASEISAVTVAFLSVDFGAASCYVSASPGSLTVSLAAAVVVILASVLELLDELLPPEPLPIKSDSC